jgi:tetratricopeptide (TPR) repeat protein
LQKRGDPQIGSEPRARLVEQIRTSLDSGEYSHVLDLVRGAGAEFPDDAELSKLEDRARDGVRGKAEADRLITESQELFAQQKFTEAIQLLRQAYELDKNNSLARAILANALVERAQSMVETDWLDAEKLANQALALNPAHPTAKTVRGLIEEQKKTITVDDWVSRARALQSSGDLFAALAWIAEASAIHPQDPRLLQVQESIQRDQGVRRRQARRRDVEDLRRMELEIDRTSDPPAKQALAERIQAVAAKYWTDGEILFIANGLLHRMGLAPQGSSRSSAQNKSTTVIFHVPRPSPVEASHADAIAVPATNASNTADPPIPPPTMAFSITPAVTNPPAEPVLPAGPTTSPSSGSENLTTSNSRMPFLAAVAAMMMILLAAVYMFGRRHQAPPVATKNASAPFTPTPPVAAPTVTAPTSAAPTASVPAQMAPEPLPPASSLPSDIHSGNVARDDQASAKSSHNVGALVVVADQDGARVFLDGKLQRQVTQRGQLLLPNLDSNNYVVQVSKTGFQDPPPQKIVIRKGEQARLVFDLKPQPQPQPESKPRPPSLSIRGGIPGTTVLIDQALVGTIRPDGTLPEAAVNPGDHIVELRKERFQTRQLKEHFVAGGTIALTAADSTLEAAPGELKITFAPADAKVALVKGENLIVVNSGVPLNLTAGTYTLTARTADRFTRWSTLEVDAQSRTLDLSLSPNGMSKWNDPGSWKPEKDFYVRKGGDFVLYGVAPTSGTFVFSAMLTKGHLLQWVLNYTDPRNYIIFQIDDNNFYRTVIRNGEKLNEVKVPQKGDKKGFRSFRIRVTSTEIVHQIQRGEDWPVIDRLTDPGANLSLGRFGFYLPGEDQVALAGFAHYADLNTR